MTFRMAGCTGHKFMKHFIIFLFYLTASADVFSQNHLDLEKIRKVVLDSSLYFSYNSLVEEFNTNPSMIDIGKGTIIYYGKLFTKDYKPYKINFDEIEFTKLVSRKKYKQAIPKGEEIIKHDPVNLEILSELSLCYKRMNSTDKAELTKIKVGALLSSILNYGSGLSKEITLKVISVGDEYAAMGMLGISGISMNSSISVPSILDTWKAKDKNGKRIDFFVEVLNNLQALPSDK